MLAQKVCDSRAACSNLRKNTEVAVLGTSGSASHRIGAVVRGTSGSASHRIGAVVRGTSGSASHRIGAVVRGTSGSASHRIGRSAVRMRDTLNLEPVAAPTHYVM